MKRPYDHPVAFSAPVWRSAFRPFYLLGALYAPLVMLAWAASWAAGWGAGALRLWHGHEMIFGFSAAIIAGIVLTALPSWAGTEEIAGRRLAALAGLWALGRLAFWLAPWLPAALVAALDVALFPAIAWLVTPQLARAANKLYLLLLPVLAGLAAGNALFHWGVASWDPALSQTGLRLGVYAIALLYALKGGVLTPIFTGNVLRERGRGGAIPFVFALDAAAVAATVLLAAVDLARLPPPAVGAAATAACVLHGWRLARWRGWRVADTPLVFAMHLGYGWMVLAFAMKAAAELTQAVPEPAWLHAFTVGSLGMMMLGLMTRVALRHTGRALRLPGAMLTALALMFVAALLRVAAGVFGLGPVFLYASALAWALPFAIYLGVFGAVLWRPSLPRAAQPVS